MKRRVIDFIESGNLLTPGSTVISCLSGGADSVCLTHILVSLGYDVIAAHCNFHLRGEESDRDQRFVEDLCKNLGIELHVKHFDTLSYAKENKLGTEEAARNLRYSWFETLRAEKGASAICVAHHRDDSIETAILNIIRGAGISGICGIKAINGYVVRPLLCLSREDIEQYLEINNLTYITDSTNLETNYNRNKVRHIIIPEIERIKPNFKDTMISNMENFSAAANIYNNTIEVEKRRVSTTYNGNQAISISKINEFVEPVTLLFEILKPYNIHPKEVSKLLTMETGKKITASSHTLSAVRKGKEKLIVISSL